MPYRRGTAASPRASTQQADTHPQPIAENQMRETVASAAPSAQGDTPSWATTKDSTEVGGQYRGPASAHSFLDKAVRNFHHAHGAQSTLASTSEDVYTSIFSHGDRQPPPVRQFPMLWPERATVDHSVRQYFELASPTYRILHQGTVERWIHLLYGQHSILPIPEPRSIPVAAKAIILLQCAIASLFATRDRPTQDAVTCSEWQQSETYYQLAEHILTQETGAPTVESVQARFLTVLYLLSTSRMNRAWFNFGPTVQLLMAIGIHRRQTRAQTVSPNQISFECSKRVLWCSFTLDQYLSLILGRPRLLREEDIDQDYPSLINDENLGEASTSFLPTRNCLMDAPVSHAKLSRILAKASQELYSIRPIHKEDEMKSIQILMEQIQGWQADLPPLLGESICPNSLISIFQRQSTVIRLARHHAVMFVTRPLLLWDFSQEPAADLAKHYLRSCIITARDTLALVLELVKEKLLFPAFWYTQYIAFNALSIVFIYLINVKNGRVPHSLAFPNTDDSGSSQVDKDVLYEMATSTQHYLSQATEMNALAWRYSLVLEVLRAEATVRSASESNNDDVQQRAQLDHELGSATLQAQVNAYPELPLQHVFVPDQRPLSWEGLQNPVLDPSACGLFESSIGNLFADDPCVLDFWPQLDRLPTSILNPRNS
ncbi:hypothetical protein N7492_009404 [Penicillium capsulatum]|uniref:Xylanolytic transcriptional activator regulatory domain-containing protein n=1 Tax=Penicillium capsulatum TaxID=69766 RepID=A0A9W9HSF9_9EURO|nr:hypothetical protein N7492_009404 [Penicillium capsulatum]KAJ6106797.1 hypothetical protein N7512_010314 [Penicillium capsulatum]